MWMVESFLNDNLHCNYYKAFIVCSRNCVPATCSCMRQLLCGQFIVIQWRRIDGTLYVLCDRQLITCKRYISIDFSSSKLKKEPAFLDRLHVGDIVGEEIALFEPHISKYSCDCEPCDVKVTKCINIKRTCSMQAIKHHTRIRLGTILIFCRWSLNIN